MYPRKWRPPRTALQGRSMNTNTEDTLCWGGWGVFRTPNSNGERVREWAVGRDMVHPAHILTRSPAVMVSRPIWAETWPFRPKAAHPAQNLARSLRETPKNQRENLGPDNLRIKIPKTAKPQWTLATLHHQEFRVDPQ